MDTVLIDTDVILDFFFDRKPFSEEASKLLSLCEKGEVKGFVTSIMLSNVYYLLRKTASHEKVIENLKILMNIIDVTTTNKKTVIEALNSEFKDFEDALQNFSAINDKEIKVIITRNIKDYKSSTLSIMTPETYLKSAK
ncbi:type II toxin-antitoxin system VapC family toxin [Aquiflexum gelatinilyticum]|uniref:type II toxin-antitoxin system VapC family toxin n=1 Tax=Aquiflexum gelatinilyticum TaxID=2961943 RepID=UPI002167A2B9|nr:PIN domain-containing protein [Aquiflexum gelatinilyticum]MCS4434702.1 PIN domain-containing protein [Aquiflexum gelatinilyticum]